VPIQVERLTYQYCAGTPLARTALADLSFTLADGSCVAIIGVTGSGKSTLVQHFNGLLRPTSGRVVVNAIDVGAKGADLAKLRQMVGLVFQSPETQLFAPTVFEEVAFGPRQLGMGAAKVARVVGEALRLVGLPDEAFGQRDPFSLSGGQMRRLALAGVLAMEPSILVLDEPTAGLDGAGRAELYRFIGHLRAERGTTILLVTHDMGEVALLAERALVLHQGRLVLDGKPRELFRQAHALLEWGLDVPALGQVVALLRKQGFPIPDEALTLDELTQAVLAGRMESEPSSGARRDAE
jgi:energy-coupling factor transport system ATP-binding protein